MARSDLLALLVFGSYFLLIAFLFALIVRSLWHASKTCDSARLGIARLFAVLSAMSFLHTWYYMIAFLLWSFRDFELSQEMSLSELDALTRLTSWLVHSELFEQAWSIVCTGPMNWWWSEKLCLFTVGIWTTFLTTEGRTRGVPHVWAYMLLGQVVAISVASNLFYLALVLWDAPKDDKSDGTRDQKSPPTILWLSVLIGVITVARSPHTTDKTFLPNLLVMHALIVVPLLYPTTTDQVSYETRTIYAVVGGISATLHTQTTLQTFLALPSDSRSLLGFAQIAWNTVHSHPAQSSITWDVIWTFVSFIVWLSLSPLGRSPPTMTSEREHSKRLF